jgi:predicted ATPase/DNA-binding winged helix-turn-helix (wHTH) protein
LWVNNRTAVLVEQAIHFGPFVVLPKQRLVFEGHTALRLGGRALDILLALIENPGRILSKDALIGRAWPNTVVEEDTLKVHISSLRRAIGDGSGGNRYIVTVTGRGYSFVAPVTVAPTQAASRQEAPARKQHNLPAPPGRLIGRSEFVDHLMRNLPGQRLLTIVGPGGIGKTAVALAVAGRLVASGESEAWLVDLAPVTDDRRVPGALATVLGLDVDPEASLPGLLDALRGRRTVIVLDTCEHVLDGAAHLANSLLQGTSDIRIIATSREPLTVDGEQVRHLGPLAAPPASADLATAQAGDFPAIELFVERASVAAGGFEFDAATAPVVAEICRTLDGIPLAIAFAAADVVSLGLHGVASGLEDRLDRLGSSRDAAVARQQTMRATLDWSYALLGASERRTLNRLAIFTGGFTLDAAGFVAREPDEADGGVLAHVFALVVKSLIAVELSGDEPRYRLLRTTRAYARALLEQSGEAEAIAARHTAYVRDRLVLAEAE